MAVEYADVEFSLGAPLDQSVNPATPVLGLQELRDGCYDTQGAIHKRPGLDALTATSTLTSIQRLIPRGNGVCAVGRSASLNRLGSWEAGTIDDWDLQDEVSEAVVERRTIARDLAEPITEAEVAVGEAWIVYVWVRTPAVGNPDVWYRIVDRATGAVKKNAILATNARAPRALASLDQDRIFVTWLAGTDFKAVVVDADGDGTLSGVTTIDAGILAVHYDILPHENTGFHFVGVNTSNDIEYYRVTNALATTVNWSIAGTFRRVSAATLEADGGAALGDLALAYWDDVAAEYRVAYVSIDTGATIAGPTALDTVEPTAQGGIAFIDRGTVQVVVTWTLSTAAGDLLKFRSWNTAATLGTLVQTLRLACTSRIFATDDGLRARFYQWCRDQVSHTLVLVNIDATTGEQPRAVATAAFGLVTSYGNNLTGVSPDDYAAGAATGDIAPTQFRACTITAILAQDTGVTAADEVIADFEDVDLYSSAQLGPATYVAGGVVQQLTDRYVDEHAFLQLPKLTVVDAAGTDLTAATTYTFALVYEYQDDLGLVHRSVPVFTTFTAVDHGGGTGGATLNLWPLTLTRRTRIYSGSFRTAPVVLLGVYQSDGANANVLYRVSTIAQTPDTLENDPTDIVPVSVLLSSINFGTLTANPQLYTTGLPETVLQNETIWGGARGLCTHKSRLFAWGGEERDVIWYSQEHVNGEPPEFSLALQLRIPGEVVVACASLDDALIAWTRDRVYAFYGDGPNAAGDPASGSFSLPIPISSETGAVSARVVASKRGVYFRGRQGIYLLDRGRQLTYVGAPVQNEIATYAYTAAALQVGARGEIRWLVNNGASAGRTLVYDETTDRWAVWTHRNGSVLEDACVVGGVFHCSAAGDLYRENQSTHGDQNVSAATYVPALYFKTNDLDFGSGQQQKRCRWVRASVKSSPNATPDYSGLQLQTYVDGSPSPSDQLTYTAAEVEAFIVAQSSVPWAGLRFKPTKQKFQRLAVVLTEVNSVDPGMTYLGLAFEVGSEGGLRRTPATGNH